MAPAVEAAALPGRHWCWSCYASLGPRPELRTARGVANTGGEAGQGSRTCVLALARRDAFLLMRLDGLGNLMPFVGLEIDHVGVARRALLFHRVADGRCDQPPPGWQEHEGAQEVGNKAWEDQENPANRCGKARGLEINGSDPLRDEGAAETIEIPSSRVSEYQDPSGRGRKKQQHGPQPADRERLQHKSRKLRRWQEDNANKGPFHQGHRA